MRKAVGLWGGIALTAPLVGVVPAGAAAPDDVAAWEKARGATLGIVVQKASGERLLSYRSDERLALTSTFKAPLCARVWEEGLDKKKGRVSLGGTVDYAPVFSKKKPDDLVTLDAACRATLRTSDNRAANFVLRMTGGPESLTMWLRSRGDTVTRVDRYEPELNRWTPKDPRDTTTPVGATALWRTLDETMRSEARVRWLSALEANETADHLLRAQPLMKGWRIADRTGSGHNTRAYHARVESPAGDVYYVAMHLVIKGPRVGLEKKDALLNERLEAVAVLLAGDAKKAFSVNFESTKR